jgi:Heterokaryon incompatibility protein (HET)
MTGIYMTLSHKWNDQMKLVRTTKDNYQQRKNGQEFESLTKTFRETLQLASRLQIRFIWIDSICIIQDGDGGADWRREALKMAQYYENSELTVAAAAAADPSSDGLFGRTRPPPTIARLPYRAKDGTQNGYFYVYTTPTPIRDSYRDGVTLGNLLTRGWVLQEYVLSSRVVTFSHTGVFFECKKAPPIDDFGTPIGFLPFVNYDSYKVSREQTEDLHVAELGAKCQLSVYDPISIRMWYSMVELYSGLSLTMTSDRVVALSGIASQTLSGLNKLEDGFSTAYASGTWVRDLPFGLAWAQDSRGTTKRDTGVVRVPNAPTWSWTSLMAPVTWATWRKRNM